MFHVLYIETLLSFKKPYIDFFFHKVYSITDHEHYPVITGTIQ